jgi:hypothetical protein
LIFGIPRKTLQGMMDSEEFAELLAYHRCIKPIGPLRDDVRMSVLAAAIRNAWGAKTDAMDFIPKWKADEDIDSSPEAGTEYVMTMFRNMAEGKT